MAVPDFQTIMRPALAALEGGDPHSLQDIRTSVAQVLGVDERDQAQLLPSGKQTTYSNRVAWALTHGQGGTRVTSSTGTVRHYSSG
jgi:restriction system protein